MRCGPLHVIPDPLWALFLGAGDAFRAAFAVALSEGLPLERALKLASAAGAITVSRVRWWEQWEGSPRPPASCCHLD